MSWEASGRLIDIIWVNWRCTCGCISYLQTQCLIAWHKWENQKKSAKTSEKTVDLHKSGSSLWSISKCLKVPRSSVQTIVREYKHHGTTQPSYRSGRRRVLSPRDEPTLVRNVLINPSRAKYLVKMLEEMGTKVSISTVNRDLHQHNLKGRSARKKPLL